jgi:outer membrane protein TolC
LQQEIEISKKQVRLNNAMGLPKITAGYMSEKVTGEQFQGVTMGITIPLWENKNNVKFAKARSSAVESMQSDYKLQYYNSLKSMHQKALASASNVADYRSKLKAFNNSELLKKALDAGEISLIEYMLELSMYYDSVDNLLQMERDYRKTLVKLEGMI